MRFSNICFAIVAAFVGDVAAQTSGNRVEPKVRPYNHKHANQAKPEYTADEVEAYRIKREKRRAAKPKPVHLEL